ncbi:WG repeat-containing protein [Epilithonimonas zeae]|uniref:WG containing repeat-containing protein n=1 Tax=Epilithonimonas zeae TaxID=1416779 RepID=A0A1N6J1U3_9FLAO|nr:WG repeat-containing protein [Epilithonimonas zeae]SIO38205.1 WG containing repeat-containing protein [Epilithonimonas zeae]
MKKLLSLCLTGFFLATYSQMKDTAVPALIPQTINQKTGYVNQSGKVVIPAEYHIAMFFSEDCNLLNSPNEKIRIYGSADYATVEKNQVSYRIDRKGTRVYQYKNEDLGKCTFPYESPKYKAFVMNGFYGLVSKENVDYKNYKDFEIYPQYQMLYVLDSDKENPMIVAVLDNKFGVINKNNQVVIPFVYDDIKTNLSWKTANLFEVSKDGNQYFYINKNNHAY